MTSITYIGMDVHTTNFTLCCYSFEDDKVYAAVQVKPEYTEILKYINRIRKQRGEDTRFVCGYEAGCLGYSLYHQLADHGVECVILAPSTMAETPGKKIKTDKRDVEKIARCLAYHQYKPVYIPDEEDDAVKEYIRMRDDVKAHLKETKQQIIAYYSIELKSVYSDGNNARITLGITAPEGVNLQEYDGYPISLQPSNRWGFFEQTTEGSSNVSGGYGSEDDGDGKANTQNVVLDYSAGTEQMRSGERPFAEGKVWSIYWQDIYGSYLNENTNEGEKVLLAEGTWSIDVVFENVTVEELEMITEPLKTKVAYGWDLQGNDVYQDTTITSFILRPMSASIICDMDHAAPDFLTVGDRCVYVVMKDGSKVAFHGDSAGSGIQNLQTDTPIDLKQVSYLLLPDGTKLIAPQG